MKIEFSSIEETTISLANVFNEQISTLQTETPGEIPEKNSELQVIPPKKQTKKEKAWN